MKVMTSSARFFIKTAGGYLSLAACVWSMAANAAMVMAKEAKTEKPEEITIFGFKHPTLHLRTTQKSMFDLYNALNTDDDNDVNCAYALPALGTKIRAWTCEFAFVENEYDREMMQYLIELQQGAPGMRPRSKEQIRNDEMPRINSIFDEMRALSHVHPELYDVMQDYTHQRASMSRKNVDLHRKH